VFANPQLAATFRRVAAHGAKEGFYRGPIAEAIVRAVAERGGVVTLEDLDAHATRFPEPISQTYRDDVRVWELPPPNHGIAALLALNCLEAALPDAGPPPHCMTWDHASVEAMRIAFADSLEHCGDPEHADAVDAAVTAGELVDKTYARRRVVSCGVDTSRDGNRCEGPAPGDGSGSDESLAKTDGLRPSPDTVYFCVVDGEGNACSFINSNYDGFGTGIAP